MCYSYPRKLIIQNILSNTGTHEIIIPVGDNCELGAQLTRAGFVKGSLFRYAASRLSNVVSLIENDFEGFFKDVFPTSIRGVTCRRYSIGFHVKFAIRQTENGFEVDSENYSEDYQKEYSKISYLVERFKKQLTGNQKVLFVYKSNRGDFEPIERFIHVVEQKYPGLDFSFLLVKTPDQKLEYRHSRLFVEDVSFFNSYEKAVDAGDKDRWFEILGKYMKVSPFFYLRAFSGDEPVDIMCRTALCFEKKGDLHTAKIIMDEARKLDAGRVFVGKKCEQYSKERRQIVKKESQNELIRKFRLFGKKLLFF